MANLTGGMAYPQPTSVLVGSSAPPISLGTRARDASGNEYVYVDFQEAMEEGEAVAISTAFAATSVGLGTVGMIGLSCGTITSDTCGWVQIYGTGKALGSSLLIIGAVGLAATSDGVAYLLPYTTALIHVEGMYVTLGSTATSADRTTLLTSDTVGFSSATSQLGGLVTVQLNYPYLSGGPHETETS